MSKQRIVDKSIMAKTKLNADKRCNVCDSKKHSVHYEEELKCEARKNSIKDGSAFSVMDGAGIRYMTPYAIALGASNAQIGFLSAGPGLIGTFFQLLSLKSMAKYSRKRIVLFGALMQALTWLPIIFIGWLYFSQRISQRFAILSTIVLFVLNFIFGSVISPVWNSWTKDILPKKQGNYFGRRAKITAFVAMTSMLVAGFILDFYEKIDVFTGFLIIFLIAFFARMVSVVFLSKQYEPKFTEEEGAYFTFREFVSKMLTNNFGRFAFFIALFMFAVSISSPFFTVFMLKDLKLNYVVYTILALTNPLFQMLFFPIWGRFGDKYGNLKSLKITGFFIPLIPLLWFVFPYIFSGNFNLIIIFLFLTEIMSGIVWAGFNLSMVNFIYDAVTRQRLAICVAYFHILNSVGTFVGAMIGGYFTDITYLFGMKTIFVVFIMSAAARMLVYLLLVPKIHEVKAVKDFGIRDVKKKILHLRPETLMRLFK